MGTLFSTLDIARSGLFVAQAQVDVAAHNISNVNTEGYSRQRAEIAARMPVQYPFGQMGRGVEVTGIQRLRDTFLDNIYRQQVPNLGAADIEVEYYSRIEDLFMEPGENGFGTRLNTFFDALSDFANNPESLPVRQSVIAESEAISTSLQQITGRLDDLRSHANDQIREIVPAMNDIADRIADLNNNIRITEASGSQSNDLRDERDRLLDELSRYVNITTNERSDGQIDVLMGGGMLVNGIKAYDLETVRNPALDPVRNDLVEVRFVDTGRVLTPETGELHGLLNVRDTVLPDMDNRMDTIASTIIEQLNRIHSQGHGLQPFSGTMTSSNAVTDPTAALGSAGLPFGVSAGSFDVVVYDASGAATTTSIAVGAATTLNDIATGLSGVPNFSASVTADGKLQVSAAAGFTFSFANDSAGVLVALGVNGLFTGTDASNMAVNDAIRSNPALLTSSYSLDLRNTGSKEAALAMSNMRDTFVLEGDTASISDYYESTIARLGVSADSVAQIRDVEQGFVDDFQRRRLEVSGVSIDEEVTTMIQFQRAFEASSRVIGVIDRMLETLINAF